MSEPRHAMVFMCDENKAWLNIVPEAEGHDDRTPAASKTYGPFHSIKEARNFGHNNFQNTGFEIPLFKLVESKNES